jgi:hypothetical protein
LLSIYVIMKFDYEYGLNKLMLDLLKRFFVFMLWPLYFGKLTDAVEGLWFFEIEDLGIKMSRQSDLEDGRNPCWIRSMYVLLMCSDLRWRLYFNGDVNILPILARLSDFLAFVSVLYIFAFIISVDKFPFSSSFFYFHTFFITPYFSSRSFYI